MEFLKTNDAEVAQVLLDLGFSYVLETVGRQTLYVFARSEALARAVLEHCPDAKFFTGDGLCF
ncbi:MAG: hypothetical protein ACLVJ6_10695 [Merdibacter sp.]